MLSYEELKPMVEMMAWKYHREAHETFEDFCQDLWIWMYETKPDNSRMALHYMKNRAIDITRKLWKDQNRRDYNDPSETLPMMSDKSDFDSIEIFDILDRMDDRERKFAIVKTYLSGNCEYLKDMFDEIIASLDEEHLAMLTSFDKSSYSDDIIFKAILGIKTGSNAGSARVVKWGIDKVIKEYVAEYMEV